MTEKQKKNVIENWRKGDTCYVVAESLAALCSSVMWKAEVGSGELGYLAQEISKQNFKVQPGSFCCLQQNVRRKRSIE